MDATDILKGKGIKKSAQRIAIISALQNKMVPLSEQEIKEDIRNHYEGPAFYQTMQLLINAEIVLRIVIDDHTIKYALREYKENISYVHFYCKKCHSVTRLRDVPTVFYRLPPSYLQEDYNVLIKGICPNCQK